MKKQTIIGILLTFVGVGLFVFGFIIFEKNIGGVLDKFSFPIMFLGVLVFMASILIIGNLNRRSFVINNFIFLFFLVLFNLGALFGAAFSNTVDAKYYFGTLLSMLFWGLFYYLQFKRSLKAWRLTWFIIMVVFLFFWQTGLGFKVGQMIFN